MDGAEAGMSSGPEHTTVVCEDPDTSRRPRQARKDPGRGHSYLRNSQNIRLATTLITMHVPRGK
jgi:hypothetical protein